MSKGKKKVGFRWGSDWTVLWIFGGFIITYFIYIPITGDKVHPLHWLFSILGGVAAYSIELLITAVRSTRHGLGRSVKQTIIAALIITVVGGGIMRLVSFPSNQVSLPPTTIEGHIERYPPSRIVNQPIPEDIQKHILEHAGRLGPGVIVQYNCTDFDCDSDVVGKLTELVTQYPNAYLARADYDGKIILTKSGKREILGQFDQERIRNFIER